MRLTRLLLRNYRVYEEQVEVEVPPGLVGIYGPNGAGKSYLIESIPWTLFGATRTTKDDVRTSGVNADCITEVEFEHEGHLYMVRRTISGQNHTVKASSHADGQQVAEGVRDTNAYVQSILGMDVAAFKASVFAEQKQLSAFSNETPAKRRDLVLRLLGILPLDTARDNARRDARSTGAAHDQARRTLPDLLMLHEAVELANTAAAGAEPERERATTAHDNARAAATFAEDAFRALDQTRQAHERLVAEGKGVAREREDATAQVQRLETELATLDEAATALSAAEADAQPAADLEGRVSAARRIAEAVQSLAALPVLPTHPPPEPDDAQVAAHTEDAAAAAASLAALDGQLQGARAEEKRAADAVQRTSALTGEADCPMCGQSLGDSYEQVVAHRNDELREIRTRVTSLDAQRKKAAAVAKESKTRADAAAKATQEARKAWTAYTQQQARHVEAGLRVESAWSMPEADGLARDEPIADVLAGLQTQLASARAAGARAAELRGRLARRPEAEAALVAQRQRFTEADGRRAALLADVKLLGFNAAALDEAQAERDRTRVAVEAAASQLRAAEVAVATAKARVEAAAAAHEAGVAQHARLDELADQSRHLGRLSDLLSAFRNEVVAQVGPTLSTHAASLFSELTDREYDQLEVDPDTYDIRITDAGRTYGMGRFSGSETDLANLALRIAISENVRLQSGGVVGLLVLDEVFGPLDDERRARMLYALERLKSRFRQVLVVTHASDIKEQLPNALEVVKLPGRRATVRQVVGP